MKKYFILLFFFSILKTSFSQSWEWIKTGGGTGDDWAYGITFDKNQSHLYILGDFANTMTINTDTLISAGNQDIFIAKYDTAGNFIWAKRAGGISVNYGSSICADDSSNIYVTGTISGPAVFDNDTVSGFGGYDICLAKYDSSGNLIWVKIMGGAGLDLTGQIIMANDGNLLMAGTYSDYAVFDTMTVNSTGQADAFMAKFSPAGNIIWFKGGGGHGDDMMCSINEDYNNNIICTGYFSDTANFGANVLIGAGASDIFIAKYTSAGNPIWIQQGGGNSSDLSVSVSSDPIGNCYITGRFTGTASFDVTTLVSAGAEDIFTSKYDANGNRKWTKQSGSNGLDGGNWIAADNKGNSYVACVKTNLGTAFDIVILKYDSAGNLKWSKKTGSTNQDQGSYITVDTLDNIYVAGMFSSQCFFDSHLAISKGSWDFFIAKLHDTITFVGINEISFGEDILIYPNPTNGTFTIKSEKEKIKKLIVYNTLGEEVYSISPTSYQQSYPINISERTNGIYFLRIETEKGIKSGKIVKQ